MTVDPNERLAQLPAEWASRQAALLPHRDPEERLFMEGLIRAVSDHHRLCEEAIAPPTSPLLVSS